MIGVPDYVEPADYEAPDTGWRPGEISLHAVEVDGREYEFRVAGSKERPSVFMNEEECPPKVMWTIVHYCRDYGIPGVFKEFFSTHDGEYRLGGLYMMAGFEPGERESNYSEYGETPYVKQ